jgi:nitrogen regulatory protein P-II 2
MKTRATRQLVVIIAEEAIEGLLTTDVMRLGAHGYSVCEVRGQGSRGSRSGEWEAAKTVRIEVLCSPDVADAILDHVLTHYFRHYAVVAYTFEVGVLRPEKF